MPAINFTAGFVVGAVVALGLTVLVLLLGLGMANAMGAHSRMHREAAFTTGLRVLEAVKHQVPAEDCYGVDMLMGIMRTDLERLRK